ncbi:MAG: hypothetical protein LBC83_05790 [Oscillospiraceae bacterium]|jgi:hypothetical protein|nr:hypothetical protein [Oscillospiraceae bacterium]
MKTLLVYYSNRSLVRSMCEASAMADVDVLQLHPRYQKRPVLDAAADCYRAITGKGTRLVLPEFTLAEYDNIVLVGSLCALSLSPELNEFLFRCNLGGRDVHCIACNRFRFFGRSGTALRKRVRLAGGVCRSVTYLSEAGLARENANVGIIALQATTKLV